MDLENLDKFTTAVAAVEPPPETDEKKKSVEKYVVKRVQEMRDFKKELKVEEKWKEADKEYVPSELDFEKSGRKRFEQSDETGWRSKMVEVKDEGEDWRSQNSDPTLLSKIQTAISIIIDQNPEATLKPLLKKHEKKTALAYALWQRNWNISGSKEVYKKFVFNLAKYGWAAGRSFPHLIKYKKDVLTEYYQDEPEKNVYEKKELVWYNDVDKENLDPFRVWLDEQTKPYDDYSTNEEYFEKDYSYDQAAAEFEKYGFEKLVPSPRNLKESYTEDGSEPAKDDEKKTRQDIITVGFFESRLRDLYVIRLPKLGRILHYCPLPNDDGLLSIWHVPWILHSAEHPYGISLWETIKQKKGLYDKMQNMTMDQLVLSIMKMMFYTGTTSLTGDGKIKIRPGRAVQLVNGKMEELKVSGPGAEAWEGLKFLKEGMDDDSGITPTLIGKAEGKTLGQDLVSRESSLKRLKVPVDNIAYAIEQDAYLSLSWMGQIYSTPEVKDFADLKEIEDYQKEMGVAAVQTVPQGGMDPVTGQAIGPFQTSFLPEISLPLEKQGNKLIESRTDRFFKLGQDIALEDIKWKGIFTVEPKSIVSSSAELEKQGKTELFNILVPLFPQPPEFFAKAAQQMVIVREEDPQDWLPANWLVFLQQDSTTQPLFLPPPQVMGQPGSAPGMGQQPGVSSNQTSMQGQNQTTPGIRNPTVVPTGQINLPQAPGSTGQRQELTRMQ